MHSEFSNEAIKTCEHQVENLSANLARISLTKRNYDRSLAIAKWPQNTYEACLGTETLNVVAKSQNADCIEAIHKLADSFLASWRVLGHEGSVRAALSMADGNDDFADLWETVFRRLGIGHLLIGNTSEIGQWAHDTLARYFPEENEDDVQCYWEWMGDILQASSSSSNYEPISYIPKREFDDNNKRKLEEDSAILNKKAKLLEITDQIFENDYAAWCQGLSPSSSHLTRRQTSSVRREHNKKIRNSPAPLQDTYFLQNLTFRSARSDLMTNVIPGRTQAVHPFTIAPRKNNAEEMESFVVQNQQDVEDTFWMVREEVTRLDNSLEEALAAVELL